MKYLNGTFVVFRAADGGIVVYDITSSSSFDKAYEMLSRLRCYGKNEMVKMIIGNKCDLCHLRQVSIADGDKFAKSHSIRFMETSALYSTNVEEAFMCMLTGEFPLYTTASSMIKGFLTCRQLAFR